MTRTTAVWGLVLVALAGCTPGRSVTEEGQRRCRLQSQQSSPLLLRPWAYGRCLGSIETVLAKERAVALQLSQQQRSALRRCEQQRDRLKQLVEAFEAEQEELSRLQAERYIPGPGPRPLSADERRSLPIYDQELLDERHAADLEVWKTREANRRQGWERDQAAVEAASRARLEAYGVQLRSLDAPLLVEPTALQLNRERLKQRLACMLEDTR